jgi:signal transduction histidine kinase/ActR/RegA family two-component response regulator
VGDRTNLDDLPALVFEVDNTGSLAWVSAEWSRLTGQSEADALAYGWARFTHPDDLTGVMATLRRAEGQVCLDFRMLVDAKPLPFTMVLRPHVVEGERVGMVGVAVPAGKSAVALERLEAHTGALLAAIPDLFFQINREGRFVDYHAPPGARLAQPPSSFVGRLMSEVLPPDITRAAMEAVALAATLHRPVPFEYRLTLDGEDFDYEARAVPMEHGDTLVVVRDVTQTKAAQAALVAAREAAVESSEHKTRFLANVSHEIRTPLNGILGVTQLLRTWDLPKETGEYLDVLQTSGEALLAIVNDVLDLSKIEANRLELEVRTFDAERAVQAAVRTFLPQAQKKGLTLTIETQLKGAVRGDAARLQQIVNNLVSNAVKFTEAGQVTVRLERLDPELVCLSVIDTGPGVAKDQQARVFEPFVQVEGTQRRYGGTGLGLSITRRLAQLMGGDVRLESEPQRGATFVVTLALPFVSLEREPASQPWSTTPPPRPLAVLLAEDNQVNAAMTSALISKLGHHVRVVTDGQAAVDAIGAHAFDLVIMDVEMPVLDGLAATRVIRQAERGGARHLPIVALTANAMKGDDVLCLAAGMDAYLPKPVTVEALQDVLSWFGGAAASAR